MGKTLYTPEELIIKVCKAETLISKGKTAVMAIRSIGICVTFFVFETLQVEET